MNETIEFMEELAELMKKHDARFEPADCGVYISTCCSVTYFVLACPETGRVISEDIQDTVELVLK